MIPKTFKGMNAIYAKDQPEYLPLPVHKTDGGTVTSCWKLSLFERIQVLFGGTIWLRVLTFNQPLQPMKLLIKGPFSEKELKND